VVAERRSGYGRSDKPSAFCSARPLGKSAQKRSGRSEAVQDGSGCAERVGGHDVEFDTLDLLADRPVGARHGPPIRAEEVLVATFGQAVRDESFSDAVQRDDQGVACAGAMEVVGDLGEPLDPARGRGVARGRFGAEAIERWDRQAECALEFGLAFRSGHPEVAPSGDEPVAGSRAAPLVNPDGGAGSVGSRRTMSPSATKKPKTAMLMTVFSVAPPVAAMPRPRKLEEMLVAMALLMCIVYACCCRVLGGSVKVQGLLALVIGGTK